MAIAKQSTTYKRIRLSAIALGACAASPLVCAGEVIPSASSSFDVVRLHYSRQKVEGILKSYDGLTVSGSKQLSEQFFAGGSYSDFSVQNDASSKQYYMYVGLFADVERMFSSQVAVQFGYRKASLSPDEAQTVSEDAGSVAVSLRNRAYDRVELRVDLEYIDWEQDESGFATGIGFSYFMTGAFTLDVAFRKQGDVQNFSGGIAYYF